MDLHPYNTEHHNTTRHNIGPHFKSPTIIKIAQVISNLHLTFLSIACKKDMEEAAVRVSSDHKRRKISLPNFSVVKS
jgi:hypothetical protein